MLSVSCDTGQGDCSGEKQPLTSDLQLRNGPRGRLRVCTEAYTLRALMRTKSIQQCISEVSLQSQSTPSTATSDSATRNDEGDGPISTPETEASLTPESQEPKHIDQCVCEENTKKNSSCYNLGGRGTILRKCFRTCGWGSGSGIDSGEESSKKGGNERSLRRKLGILDVIFLGIGSTIGAGVYSLIGISAQTAGPGVVVSALLCGFSCLMTALVYAEFSARVPVAGSAYTYAYVIFGELVAFGIGWALTLEYAISSAVISRSFGEYFVIVLSSFGVNVPSWLTNLNVFDLSCSPLASLLIVLCSLTICTGVKSSAIFNAVVTTGNLIVLCFAIIAGGIQVDSANWTAVNDSFFPMGFNSVATAAGQLYMAFLGFDFLTTVVEEVKRPVYIPIGLMSTLGVATVLMVLLALIITGMVPYTELTGDTALSSVFDLVGMPIASQFVSIGAVLGTMASCFNSLLGQSRIFFRMSRDGIFFEIFGYVSAWTGAPVFGVLLTGLFCCLIAFFASLETLSSTISIGTLLAFCIVDCGLILTRHKHHNLTLLPHGFLAWFIVFFFSGCYCLQCDVELWASITLLVLALPAVGAMWWFIPKEMPKASFLCPFVPFTPFLGIAVNLFLLSGLDSSAWIRIAIWIPIGLIIYFLYGIRYSKLREFPEKPTLSGYFCCSR
ncbi:amino acid permease [Pelomyxa schiedti]|nr:amino acid permease [Pelomyxa schiedti]